MKKLLLAPIGFLLAFPALAQSTLYSNSTTGDVGIGTVFPINSLDIYGQAVIGTGYAGVDTAPSNGLLVQGDVGIGTATQQGLLTIYGASTVASAASAKLDYISLPASTTTITGTTGITTAKGFNAASLYKPTYTDTSSVTITNAATLYIDNAPAAAGSVTITNPWAISVGAGNVSFPGTGNALGTITSGTWNGGPINLSSYASGTLQAAQFPALTNDVTTTAGSLATTVEAIQGNSVSGTTGADFVVFSASPTLTGTVTGAASNWSGNVGVGTTSPGGLFTVGNNAFEVNSSGDVTSGLWNGSVIGTQYGGLGANESSASGIVQFSSGTSSVSTTLTNGTTATTQSAGDTSSDVATDAFVNTTALTLANGTTATTQSAGDNSTKVATTAYVATAVTSSSTVNLQTFTSSGTWTKPSVATLVVAQCWGGGGGAAGCYSGSGGGGGGGGYSQQWFAASSLGSTVSVTVGSGGSGTCASTAGNGGNSSFSSMTVYGGTGGQDNKGGTGGFGLSSGGNGGCGNTSVCTGYTFNGVSSGGGGGGGAGYDGSSGLGGASGIGGAGGNVNNNGAFPAGGGGTNGSSYGGNGAAGECIITTW